MPIFTWRRVRSLGPMCVVLFTVAAAATPSRAMQTAAGAAAGQASAALAAAKASPELVGEISKAIGATTEQSAGAAGALFGLAKSRLKPAEFGQVSAAVPGMDALLKAAPAVGGSAGAPTALSQLAGSASGLASAASAFTKLGLKPEMVAKVVPILTSFVTKSGGANVASLLGSVLK